MYSSTITNVLLALKTNYVICSSVQLRYKVMFKSNQFKMLQNNFDRINVNNCQIALTLDIKMTSNYKFLKLLTLVKSVLFVFFHKGVGKKHHMTHVAVALCLFGRCSTIRNIRSMVVKKNKRCFDVLYS